MGQRIKVLCLDDSADLVEMLALLIRQEDDLEHVGTLQNASGLLGAIERLRPHVALVDLTMAGKPPLEAIREASIAHPETRSVVYSGRDDVEIIAEAMDAGAWGFVSKNGEPSHVLDAVRRVANGEIVSPHL